MKCLERTKLITYILWRLGLWLLFMHLGVFCNQITTRKKSWIIIIILLFIIKGNSWNLFMYGVCILLWMLLRLSILPIFHIYVRSLFCCFIMTIRLTLVISSRLIMQFILFSTIIIGGTWWFMIITITLWLIYTRVVCVMI